MADLNDLIRSKKVKEFVRKEKSRPWTVSTTEVEQTHKDNASPIAETSENRDNQQEPLATESKTRNEPAIKLSQTEAKVEPQHESKLSQTEAKVEPILKLNKVKVEPQVRPQHESKLSQTEAKVEPILDLSALVGLQKNILLSIYESCRFAGSKITSAIAIENLARSAESTTAAARKAVQRLEEKGFLLRKEFKNGRGGWTKYELPDVIYQQVMFSQTEAKVEPNLGQTRAKLRTEVEPQVRPEPSSSSSDLYINNKTTTQSLAWIEGINLDAVQSAGITQSVLLRCCELYPTITPEAVEDLVYRFAEFMKSPKNRVQNARGFFIGLAKQLSEGITPLDHIETSNDRLMREYAEKLREKKERQEQFEKEAMEFAFADWVKELSSEGRAQVVPESQFAKLGSPGHDAMLKKHFRDNVWPDMKTRIERGELSK